jgi:hypothetical protein
MPSKEVGIEVIEGKQQVVQSVLETLSEIEMVWVIFIVLLSALPPIPTTRRGMTIRVLIVTIVGWIWANWFRTEIRLGWLLTSADLGAYPEYSSYDGVGGNVFVFVFGWVPFLLGSIVVLFVSKPLGELIEKIVRRMTDRSRKMGPRS